MKKLESLWEEPTKEEYDILYKKFYFLVNNYFICR